MITNNKNKYKKNNSKYIYILGFKNDTTLQRTFSRTPPIPEWVKLWRAKKKVWIDLSRSNDRIQKMVITGIFHTLLSPTNHYQNYWDLNGLVVVNGAFKVFKRVPLEQYKANYERRRNHWRYLREQNLFLTKEQILEAYGDINYLFNSQLDYFYHEILDDEFRYQTISLFTGVDNAKSVHEAIEKNS